MTLYLSGPITGTHDYKERFAAAQAALEAAGYDVINPVLLPHKDPDDWEACMRLCISELVWADGVCLLDGWKNSRGAEIEWSVARGLGFASGTLERWLARAHALVSRAQKTGSN